MRRSGFLEAEFGVTRAAPEPADIARLTDEETHLNADMIRVRTRRQPTDIATGLSVRRSRSISGLLEDAENLRRHGEHALRC